MDNREANKALTLSTLAFAIAFALWGMIAPMAKTFQKDLGLTDGQRWMLVAIPVILGSVGRLPMGMLTDRFGGRIVFGLLLFFISLPALVLSFAHSYPALLIGGLFLGMAGTSFAIGVAFTSKWFPPERQGFALGIYGAGNIGQSLALFGVPVLADLWSWQVTYRLFAAVALLWGVVFFLSARDAAVSVKPKGFGEMLRVLYEQPLSWLLSLFYFVTFGGFVALSIGLPGLLQDIFHVTARDAGFRAAGFVVLATLMRPLGGWISDRIGGARLLKFVFAGAGVLALGLTFEHMSPLNLEANVIQTASFRLSFGNMIPFTIGALGVAACIGLGNGAVFKLVPQYFPKDTGTVTGLVGAMGGLGGFFPPIVLGMIKTHTGKYDLGFILLSAFCWLCFVLNYLVFLRSVRTADSAAAQQT